MHAYVEMRTDPFVAVATLDDRGYPCRHEDGEYIVTLYPVAEWQEMGGTLKDRAVVYFSAANLLFMRVILAGVDSEDAVEIASNINAITEWHGPFTDREEGNQALIAFFHTPTMAHFAQSAIPAIDNSFVA